MLILIKHIIYILDVYDNHTVINFIKIPIKSPEWSSIIKVNYDHCSTGSRVLANAETGDALFCQGHERELNFRPDHVMRM